MNAVTKSKEQRIGYVIRMMATMLAAAFLSLTNATAAEDAALQGANTVQIQNFSFSPQTLTVPAGATVTWINRDDEPHTATSSANPHVFNSPALDTGEKFSFTFSTPGTYKYFCAIHPHMVGVIVVK